MAGLERMQRYKYLLQCLTTREQISMDYVDVQVCLPEVKGVQRHWRWDFHGVPFWLSKVKN